jgi:hypothetical protein
MRNLKAISLLAIPLLGCYAELENPSITVAHNLCGGTTSCMPGAMPLDLIQISGQNTFALDFGDQPLLKPSSELGPTTLKTSLTLNGAGVALQNASSGNFNNVTWIKLFAAPSATTDCRATGSNCTLLADFDRTRDGQANQTLTLRSQGLDVINFISTATHTLQLQLNANGQGPSGAWNAEVSMDMALTSRANFP